MAFVASGGTIPLYEYGIILCVHKHQFSLLQPEEQNRKKYLL